MGTSPADWIMAGGTAGAALAATFAARKAAQSTAASVDLVRIERQRLEEERRQRAVAELRVERRRAPDLAWQIALVNGGPSPAFDVSMFVHNPDDPATVYRLLDRKSEMPRTEDRMAPEDEIVVSARRGGDSPSLNAGVTFAWTDSRGPHEHSVTVTGYG